ncbi:glycine zipper 2TM domain-containing protein [Phenylobacterium sp.]|uniref:glycine zipper 2TM domain-containing protein n=1 Tax=Phenylobacterium sp. TaxID=1871053 RepID=UPI00289DC6EB|nr:glycine zipper 2TM domain-containing protein [Phenylobacterium sp.]
MKRALALAAAGMIATSVPVMAFPSVASAQSYDPCREQQRQSANKGTIVGGLVGALAGGGVAAKGAKTEGAVLGGAVGAVAGHEIGKRNSKCSNYRPAPAPRPAARTSNNYQRSNYSAPSNCRWVQDNYGGRNHSYEVCRSRDGVWRPSGRS